MLASINKRIALFLGCLLIVFQVKDLQAAELPEGVKLSKNQTLTRSLRGDPESLDPHLTIDMPGDHVTRELFEGLVTQDIQGNIIPGQASHWTVSKDHKTWTFHLRKGLTWSDGTPLTAADFEYSFKRLANPNTASTYGWYLGSMGVRNATEVVKGDKPVSTLGVKAGSENTLTLELSEPAPYLLAMLTHRSLYPVPRHTIEKHGKDWITSDNIVVNGPYILSKRVLLERMELKRNPSYWNNEKTVIEKVTFLPLESEVSALNRYRTHEIDIVYNIPTSHYRKLQAEMPNELKSTPSLATYYLTFNTREKPFDDVRVRKALSYTINRDLITQNVLGQGQATAYTFTPNIVTGFTPPTPEYQKLSQQERVAEARKLLAEAGFSSQKPLEFSYMFNATDANRFIAVALQEMWQTKLPVKVTLQSQEWSSYLQNKRDGKYQAARALWGGDFNDAITMLDMNTPKHSNNSSFFNNSNYNQLLKQASKILNDKKRNELYAKAELILAEEMPIAPIYWNSNNYLIKPDLRGVSYQNPEGRIFAREIYRVDP